MNMNYNPNPSIRNPVPGPLRKMKRVSDVNAVGPAAPVSATYNYAIPTEPSMMHPVNSNDGALYGGGMPQTNTFNGNSAPVNQNYGFYPQVAQQQPNTFPPQIQEQQYTHQFQSSQPNTAPLPGTGYGVPSQNQFPATAPLPSQFAMFQQPIVHDMAMQYGQRLADQGKQMVESQFDKYIPVAKLRYYFAVDNNYVINKLRLLVFPFTHKDWSLKYDQEDPVQPRYDINAPDLYIPTMAYITYVVVAGLMLGMQKRFSPEQLGIQASSALAYSIFELIIYSIILYVVNIKTNLKTLDLLAFSGYKFVIIVNCLLISTLFYGLGYYLALLYFSLTLGFFLLRTLKTKVLQDNSTSTSTGDISYDPYGNPQSLDYTGGRKRKLYFLFMIVGGQAFLSFLLSKHLFLREAIVSEI